MARIVRFLGIALLLPAWLGVASSGHADESARMKQLRLLCAQLSGDLMDPGGIAAFRRCLTTHDPLGEIKRDNNIGGGGPRVVADRPNAKPPKGFGHDSRKQLATGVDRFATADGKIFYAIDRDNTLWRFNPAIKGDAKPAGHKIADFSIEPDGHLMILDTDGHLTRDAATRIDDRVTSFQRLGTSIYVRGTDAKLWREMGDAAHRAPIDVEVASFQAVDAKLVFVLSRDGTLWRENGDARDRKSVASQVAAFQYTPNGDAVYVLGKNDTLWRQVGTATAEQIDRDIAAFQALDARFVFVLGRDGRLWQQTGKRDHAVLVDRAVLSAVGRAAFDAADAQHVYVLGADHQLWAETMPAGR